MLQQIFYILLPCIVVARGRGDLVISHAPDSILFRGNEEIAQSLLKEVFSAALGYTVKQRSEWNGMAITNPLTLPEAVVGVAIEGVDSLSINKGHRFPLCVDEVEETTWQALSGRLEERDNHNNLIRIYLGDGLDALGQSALGELKPNSIDENSLKALNLKIDEDRKFLEEVQLFHAIAKKIPTAINADGKPDVYWLVVSGIKPLLDYHGNDSAPAQEALLLLNEAISTVSKSFAHVYKNQVLIAVFTNDASQVRHTRSSRQKREDIFQTDLQIVRAKDINVASSYSENYPVMFNIFLWFTFVFFFSLLAVCVTISQMDPGRDSIIYRMTSNRMKKES